MEYVCGFLFSEDASQVLLIQKLKPQWQQGKYNGIGGKIEPNESPWHAMVREFKEETSLEVETWDEVFILENNSFTVYFFRAFGSLAGAQSITDEQVSVHRVDDLPDVIPNLRWVIPLLLDEDICSGSVSLESVM